MLRTHVPPPHLRPYVAVAYGYQVPANPVGVHRGLPSRHVTLVIEINGPLRVSGLGSPAASHGVVGGLHTTPALIDASRPQEGLQYALSPLAAGRLLGVPAAAIGGRVVDLADIVGTAGERLVDNVASTDDWGERFRLVDATLSRRLGDTPRVDTTVGEAWRLIFESAGRLSVAHIADRVGYSRRHLSARLRVTTGVTPKQAARIARFEVAHGMLRRAERPTLARVAAACGYSDQPHLAREWKALAGCTVTTWLREEFPFVQDLDTGSLASSLP